MQNGPRQCYIVILLDHHYWCSNIRGTDASFCFNTIPMTNHKLALIPTHYVTIKSTNLLLNTVFLLVKDHRKTQKKCKVLIYSYILVCLSKNTGLGLIPRNTDYDKKINFYSNCKSFRGLTVLHWRPWGPHGLGSLMYTTGPGHCPCHAGEAAKCPYHLTSSPTGGALSAATVWAPPAGATPHSQLWKHKSYGHVVWKSIWKHCAVLCHSAASHQTEDDLRSCERPRLIICGVMVELKLRFPSTSSTDLSVFTGEWVE